MIPNIGPLEILILLIFGGIAAVVVLVVFLATKNRKPAAGWLADPYQPGQLRWWDGQQWTGHVAPGAAPEVKPGPQ